MHKANTRKWYIHIHKQHTNRMVRIHWGDIFFTLSLSLSPIFLWLRLFVILQLQYLIHCKRGKKQQRTSETDTEEKNANEWKKPWHKRYLSCIHTCKTGKIVTNPKCTLLFCELIFDFIIHSTHLCRWAFPALFPSYLRSDSSIRPRFVYVIHSGHMYIFFIWRSRFAFFLLRFFSVLA